MANGDLEPSESVVYTVAISALFAVAVGLNVYIIVDQMTDGQLSREASVYMRKLAGRASAVREREKTFRRDVAQMLWQAHTIVEEGSPHGD